MALLLSGLLQAFGRCIMLIVSLQYWQLRRLTSHFGYHSAAAQQPSAPATLALRVRSLSASRHTSVSFLLALFPMRHFPLGATLPHPCSHLSVLNILTALPLEAHLQFPLET